MGHLYHSKLLNFQMAQLDSYWGWAVFETLFHCIWLMLRTGSTLHVWRSYPILYIYIPIYIYTHILFIWFSMFFPYWMIIPNKDWMMFFFRWKRICLGPWGWVYLFMVQSIIINSTSIYQHSPKKIHHFHVMLHVKIMVSQCFPRKIHQSFSEPLRRGGWLVSRPSHPSAWAGEIEQKTTKNMGLPVPSDSKGFHGDLVGSNGD